MNKVMLIGNLGADPEIKYTSYGNPVTNFRIAVNRTFTDSFGENYEDTEWFNVCVWGTKAKIVNKYLFKGRKVFVEGRFKSKKFIGNDGIQRRFYEIVANDIRFIDKNVSR